MHIQTGKSKEVLKDVWLIPQWYSDYSLIKDWAQQELKSTSLLNDAYTLKD